MSNKVLILWGTLIIAIMSSILVIGKYYESNYKYFETNREVKGYLKKYIDEESIKINNFDTIIVSSEELREKKYFEEIKVDEISCEFEAEIKNCILFKIYRIKYECINSIDN